MKEIALFADASYQSFEMTSGELIVVLKSWDNKLIKVTFSNVIAFTYKIESVVTGLYEDVSPMLLAESLSLYYENIPETHSFQSFALRDIDDVNFIEVVAESVVVVRS